ncbi:MAG: rRNA adenine N-6-methyltransferase family protein, partial [Mycobacterium sp.]
MNEAHQYCGSDEWRQIMRDVILPWALADTDLGDDVLEVGPGYGATTDVLSRSVPRLTSVEIDEKLATMLTDRFADIPSGGSPVPPVSPCCITSSRPNAR